MHNSRPKTLPARLRSCKAKVKQSAKMGIKMNIVLIELHKDEMKEKPYSTKNKVYNT